MGRISNHHYHSRWLCKAHLAKRAFVYQTLRPSIRRDQGLPYLARPRREVIVINDKGKPDFEALQKRLRPRDGKLPGHLCYIVFDCLYVNDHFLLNQRLEYRQAVLCELQPALQSDAVKLTEGFPAEKSKRLMKACALMGLEGIIMKRKGSLYRPGFRSPD